MKIGARAVATAVLLLSMVLLTGCFFNIFQTARTVGAGNVALTLGVAAVNLAGEGDYNWVITPQGGLAIGLSDNVELGFRSGVLVPLATGEPGFLGAVGDIKVSLFHEPESLSLALGFGGGYSMGMLGWGLEGSLYFDSNLRFLPLYVVYRPLVPLEGDGFSVIHQLAGGLHLTLSENARLLLELDLWSGLLSAGIGLEILF